MIFFLLTIIWSTILAESKFKDILETSGIHWWKYFHPVHASIFTSWNSSYFSYDALSCHSLKLSYQQIYWWLRAALWYLRKLIFAWCSIYASWKNNSHFPYDAYMCHKSLNVSYSLRRRPGVEHSWSNFPVQLFSVFTRVIEILGSCWKWVRSQRWGCLVTWFCYQMSKTR